MTTVFEMPISKPCCATGEIFAMRKALAQRDSYVNFGLYGAPGLLDRAEIAAMVDQGAIAFKIFMTSAPKGRDDEFEGLCLPEVPELYQALKLVAETGLVCAVHAENNQLLEWHTRQLNAAGRNDVPAHGESRPPHVEALAIATLLTLNESIGVNLHIAHLSAAEPLAVFRRFKATGSTASAETCPHYLFFTEEDLARVGPYAKIKSALAESSGPSRALGCPKRWHSHGHHHRSLSIYRARKGTRPHRYLGDAARRARRRGVAAWRDARSPVRAHQH